VKAEKIIIMKKVKLNSKLSLSKETIAKLNNGELNNVKGGTGGTLTEGCCQTDECCSIGCCGNRATYFSYVPSATCQATWNC